MKKINLLFLSLLIFAACTSTPPTPDSDTPLVVYNKKTESHVKVPGAPVFMIPPPNFHPTLGMDGFQVETGLGFITAMYTEHSFKATTEKFDRASHEKQGAKILEETKLKVNGLESVYMFMETKSTNAYWLVIGNDHAAVMIMAGCPKADKKMNEEIKKALFSVYCEKDLEPHPLDYANFILDENASLFKYADFDGTKYTYTRGGKIEESFDLANPILKAQFLPIVTESPEEGVTSWTESLDFEGFKNARIIEKSNVTVNGIPGYEAIVECTEYNVKCKVYMLMVVKDEVAVAIRGFVKTRAPDSIEEMRKLAHTVVIKEDMDRLE